MPKITLFGTCLLLLFACSASAQLNVPEKSACYRWRTQVDPKLDRIDVDDSKLTDRDTVEAITCLLALEGEKGTARFTGYTRTNLNASGRPPKITRPASVQVAALYYVSYLFYKNWEHAGSVQIYDPETERSNTKENVRRAFESYKKWFRRLQEIGLDKARELRLDPLDGSEVQWS